MTVKQVIGEGAPVTIEVEATMQDILIQPGHSYSKELPANRTLAMMVIEGKGLLVDEISGTKHHLEPRYFAVVHAGEFGTVAVQAEAGRSLRIALIEVPAKVDYPLYKEGR